MSSSATAAAPPVHTGNTFPLTFKQHNIEAHCYNTRTCSVVYDGQDLARRQASTPSPAPATPDYRQKWGFAATVGVRNFPPPAQLRWTAQDGSALQAQVDIGSIFKDERVLHRVAEADIPDGAFVGPAGAPSIYIEVNDRTVTVLMKAFIPTREPQVRGNPDSDFRADLIEAWKHTY